MGYFCERVVTRLTSSFYIFSSIYQSDQSLIFFGFQAEVCGTGLSIETDKYVLSSIIFHVCPPLIPLFRHLLLWSELCQEAEHKAVPQRAVWSNGAESDNLSNTWARFRYDPKILAANPGFKILGFPSISPRPAGAHWVDPLSNCAAGRGGEEAACGFGGRGQRACRCAVRWTRHCSTPRFLLAALVDLNKRSLRVGCVCHWKDNVGEVCLKRGKPNKLFSPCKF